jgi:hypothetical protein
MLYGLSFVLIISCIFAWFALPFLREHLFELGNEDVIELLYVNVIDAAPIGFVYLVPCLLLISAMYLA